MEYSIWEDIPFTCSFYEACRSCLFLFSVGYPLLVIFYDIQNKLFFKMMRYVGVYTLGSVSVIGLVTTMGQSSS